MNTLAQKKKKLFEQNIKIKRGDLFLVFSRLPSCLAKAHTPLPPDRNIIFPLELTPHHDYCITLAILKRENKQKSGPFPAPCAGGQGSHPLQLGGWHCLPSRLLWEGFPTCAIREGSAAPWQQGCGCSRCVCALELLGEKGRNGNSLRCDRLPSPVGFYFPS